MKTDIEIAREAQMNPIAEVAYGLGLTDDDIELYGKYKCKITEEYLRSLEGKENGKLDIKGKDVSRTVDLVSPHVFSAHDRCASDEHR